MITLHQRPILEQLQLEEALLRTSDENYLIINYGSSPAIVMGISGKPEKLVKLDKLHIPLIKRYSGGGTVVVDEDTLFISFIFNRNMHTFELFPRPILEWSAKLYQKAFPLIELHANDYAIGDRKIGGNAQYIKKDRWVHHTTFLWDYQSHLMDLLLQPESMPDYRQNRPHEEFITKLSLFLPSMHSLVDQLLNVMKKSYILTKSDYASNVKRLYIEHRKSTQLVVNR